MTSSGERSAEVDAYVARLEPDMRQIVAALRYVIFEAESQIEEAMRSGHPSYSLAGPACDILEAEGHGLSDSGKASA